MKTLTALITALATSCALATPALAQESNTTAGAESASDVEMPVLRERKMSEWEQFTRTNEIQGTPPAYTEPGERGAAPDSTLVLRTEIGQPADPAMLSGVSSTVLRRYISQRQGYIGQLRDVINGTIGEVRAAKAKAKSGLDPAIDAGFAALHEQFDALETELNNIESAQRKLDEPRDVEKTEALKERLEGARAEVRMMERAKSKEEFDQRAASVRTSLAVVQKESAALAAR